MTNDAKLRPVCFMIMPFRTKKVTGSVRDGAPKELNCDALWDKAFRPAIEDAGYTPVRADFDTGSVIIKDMLERLAFADLIIADVSLPNGNVYYEIGLRHVAHETGCILFASDWSRQLFDIDQFTSVRYPLTDGRVPDDEAEIIRQRTADAIANLKHSRTPWHEFITGPVNDQKERGVFREFAEQMSRFQADVRSVRITGDKAARKQKVATLRETLAPSALEISDVAIEMLALIRDEIGWADVLSFVDGLDPSIARLPVIQEQRLLALAETGAPEDAIASLEELMRLNGETPERLGIIGGRYKRLHKAAREARVKDGGEQPLRQEKRLLNKAIDHYTRGMQLDYNAYYCACNLPQLLVDRGDKGDAERAVIIEHFVVAACDRAIAMGEDDGWTRPTLLGAAFRAHDVDKASDLAERVATEGPANWQLKSTIEDLRRIVGQADGTPESGELQEILAELEEVLAEAGG